MGISAAVDHAVEGHDDWYEFFLVENSFQNKNTAFKCHMLKALKGSTEALNSAPATSADAGTRVDAGAGIVGVDLAAAKAFLEEHFGFACELVAPVDGKSLPFKFDLSRIDIGDIGGSGNDDTLNELKSTLGLLSTFRALVQVPQQPI